MQHLTETTETIHNQSNASYRWITLAACFLVVTITNGSAFSFGVFLNPFKESFGATSAAVSAVYSVTLWIFAFFGIFSGWSVDRYGPKITITAGACILGSGFLLTGFISSLWQLYLTAALIGIGLSCGYVPTMTTVSRAFRDRRGFALGLNSAGIGLGPLIMAPFQTHLILLGGWRSAYLVTACIIWAIIPVVLLLRSSPHNRNKETPPPPLSPRKTIAWVFKVKVFWLFCFLFLCIGVAVQTVVAHIVAYSQNLGVSPMTAAAVLSSVTGSSMVGRIGMGSASDVIGRQRALFFCTFLEGLMLVWLLTTSSTWALFVFGLLFGLFYGGHAPQLPALIGETLGFENMGAILGVINLFWGIGSAIGPYTTGYLFDVTGSYRGGFVIATALMFSASAISFFLKTSKSAVRAR